MTDIWIWTAVIIGMLLLPIIIPIVYYLVNPDSFRQNGVWIWLVAGIIELLLLFVMMFFVI